MSKPNIIMILADDLGYGDCSCYGQETWRTPHIDRMAEEGLRFTDYYTTSPVCAPARASVLTGKHSGHLAIRSLKDGYLPDDLNTIPKALKEQGYLTAIIGKYGVGNGMPDVDPIRKGFDYHYGYNCMFHAHNYFPPFLRENGLRVPLRNVPPADDKRQRETGVGVAEVKVDYSPDFIDDHALDFIASAKENPFFLYYTPTLPHANNEGGDTPDGMEVDTYGDFEDEDWAPNEKGFARMVQRLDEVVGKVLDKLDELGIAENTLVVFSSDNGPHNEGGHKVTRFNSSGGFQGYKRSLHEGGIRIPFIARWKGVIEPGVTDHMGYFPDLLPTFCDAAGVESELDVDGKSILPLLTGNKENLDTHEYLYFEFNNQLAVRKGNMKYYRSEEGEESLYRLDTDRRENVDLKAERPGVFAELKGYVDKEHIPHTSTRVPAY
ncbi:MAG: arylsulfatase, partial [Verrucomicrobiota bacterium]